MLNLKEITSPQLMEPAFAEKVFKVGHELMIFPTRQTKQLAETIAQVLSLDVKKEYNEIEKEYFALVSRLRFSALSYYPVRAVESFFEHCIYDALALEEFDLESSVKANLIYRLFPHERDFFKKRLREALTRNMQVVSNTPIEVAGKLLPSNVQNWFKDYFNRVGIDYANTVAQAQYFFSSPNFVKLPELDKNKLKELFSLYEKLKISSRTLEGIEENIGYVDKNGNIIDFQEGVPIRLSTSGMPMLGRRRPLLKRQIFSHPALEMTQKETETGHRKLMQEYLGPEEERTKIHQEETSLEKIATGDLSPVRQVFLEALNQKDKYKAIAALRILAQKGNLLDELRYDEKISTLFKNFLKESYRPEVLADFLRQGFMAAYFSLFLQRVLKNQLGLSSSDSARIGIQLENILEQKGNSQVQGMVYGDLVKGEYAWQEVKDEGVRLMLKGVK